MSDIKLFHIGQNKVTELKGFSSKIEKSLQTLIESNLDAYLGVRFLASEYRTGANHGGIMDTLGIDENGSPVIIEYKRSMNENFSFRLGFKNTTPPQNRSLVLP